MFNGSLRRVFPKFIQATILYLSHYPVFAGHITAWRMYDSVRVEIYCPHIANNVYATVKDCRSCASTREILYNHQEYLKHFRVSGPLEFVSMDLLGPLPRRYSGNQSVVFMNDRYPNLTRPVSTTITTALHITSVFLDLCTFPYGIPRFILSENGSSLWVDSSRLWVARSGVRSSRWRPTMAYNCSDGEVQYYHLRTLA